MGKRVSVISTLQTQPPMIADELRRQADQFIDIADLESSISREASNGHRPPQRDARLYQARNNTFSARDDLLPDSSLARDEV